MNTTATKITINVNDNRTGNLMAMTDAVNPDLGMCDTIYGLVLPDTDFIGIEVEGGYLQPMNSPIHSKMMRKLVLGEKGSNRKLVMDYNSQTGQYEISKNDFMISEISTLAIEVHRIDFNRVPRPAAA
jgi:hypothetical protein